MDYTEKAEAVRQRIKTVLQEKGISENSVAAGDGAVQSRLNSQLSHGKRITLDTVLRILDTCPDISADWLLRGIGDVKLKLVDYSITDNATNTLSEGFVRDLLAEKDKQIQALIGLIKKQQSNSENF